VPAARILISSLYRVGFADPSKGKTHTDSSQSRSAIAIMGQDEFEREFLLDEFAEQCPTSTFIEQIVTMWRTWRPRVFGVDTSGPQKPFYDSLIMETRRRGMKIPFLAVDLKGEKIARIEDRLEPSLSDGRMFIHPEAKRAHDEGLNFPNGYMDLLDCMSECHKLFPKRQTTQTKITEREREIESMKRQGTPYQTIMTRLAAKYGR
jgi:predicted phage terminase large subunit-like protein